MLSVAVALVVLCLSFILVQVASTNARNAERRELVPVRVRVEGARLERRRMR